jgi:hypothetical protein
VAVSSLDLLACVIVYRVIPFGRFYALAFDHHGPRKLFAHLSSVSIQLKLGIVTAPSHVGGWNEIHFVNFPVGRACIAHFACGGPSYL